MRTWRKASRMEVCGRCIKYVVAGANVMIIELPDVKQRRVRCEPCARRGGDVPPDVIPSEGVEVPKAGPVRWKIASLPFDHKQEQAGESIAKSER